MWIILFSIEKMEENKNWMKSATTLLAAFRFNGVLLIPFTLKVTSADDKYVIFSFSSGKQASLNIVC